jgi:hypothetical protein
MILEARQELLALGNGQTDDPVGKAHIHLEGVRENWTRGNQESGDRFGDNIKLKKTDTIRIGFQNIGGFPMNKSKDKEGIIRQGLTKWDFDMFGCAETNVDWHRVLEEGKLIFELKNGGTLYTLA